MLNLTEYRRRPALLADWLPWAGLIAPGVVLNKDGSFQRTARFRGPDLDSATQSELIATSARLNNALRRLGSGWALFIEAERRAAAGYPRSDFPEPLSWLVDEERRAAFEASSSHFESGYHLTLAYLPPEESRARAAKLLYENAPGDGVDWHGRLEAFVAETDRVFDLLDGVMPEITWLDDGQTLTYLHSTISTRRYRGSRIFAFDMGRSMRATILGLGGEHYDLGHDGEIAFQPLARIDAESERTWAAEWLEGRLRHEDVAVGPDEKAAIWSALGSLAGAPVEQRTMTGLSVLLQSNALRQALAPYVLGGAHGKLLDADHDRLGMAHVQCFEMEELMASRAAVLAVLGYLFARFDERFDGAPTLLILDESWLFLDDPVFAARIRQWLKTLRKKNVSVIFATQSLADIKESSIAPAIIESCASRIFLPNPQATEPQIRTIYEGFGLNARQIEIVATAEPKRDYYYQSRLGNRLFDLDLGPAALAFVGASTPQDQRDMDRVLAGAGLPGFAGAWLRHCGLEWAADLLPTFPGF